MQRSVFSIATAMRPPLTRHLLWLAGTFAIAAVLTGCDGARLISESETRPVDIAKLHPISAEVQWASLDVATIRGAGLGSTSFLEVTRFVREYRRDGRSPLEVEVPSGRSGSGRAIDAIRYIAEANGVPARRIKVIERRSGDAGITLKYERIAAISPTCGDWSEDAVKRPELGPYRNFGCASQRNLANMVANPTDLLFPEVEAPRPSDSRGARHRSYSTGTLGGTTGAQGSPFTR